MQRFSQKVSHLDYHLCMHDKECLKSAPGIYGSHKQWMQDYKGGRGEARRLVSF